MLCWLAVSVNAQLTANQRIGAYAVGGYVDPNTVLAGVPREPNWRKVGTNILDANNFTEIGGAIDGGNKNVALVHRTGIINNYLVIAVKNLPGETTQGRNVIFKAVRAGIYNDHGTPLEQWDCGTIPSKTDLQNKAQADYLDYKIREAEKQKKLEAIRAAAQQKKKAAETIALKSNQEAAAKGDSYGLLRMGERYRDGDGVEKDLAKARDYLQKAADAGSPTAKEDLSKLEAK